MSAAKRDRKPMTIKRQLKRLAILLAGFYVLALLGGLMFINHILFQPHRSSYQDGPNILKLTTADGTVISAMHLPAKDARYTILFSHGNGEDMGDLYEVYERLRGAGFSVLAYDYHGYGTSGGKPTEANCYLDIEAAYEYITQTLGVGPERLIAHGRSVGGGPSVELACRKPIAGLVLESTFTSAMAVNPVGRLVPGDYFRNRQKLADIKCPVLVMHGQSDWIVPSHHGHKLFAAASQPKQCLWIEKAGHNDLCEVAGPRYEQAMLDFARLLDEQP